MEPEGRRLLAVSRQGQVGIWRLPAASSPQWIPFFERELRGPGEQGITEARFLPGGKGVVAALADGQLGIWSPKHGWKNWGGQSPRGPAEALAVTAQRRLVAAAFAQTKLAQGGVSAPAISDGPKRSSQVLLWRWPGEGQGAQELSSFALEARLGGIQQLAFSPDGRWGVARQDGPQGKVHLTLWPVEKPAQRKTVTTACTPGTAVSWTPGSGAVVCACGASVCRRTLPDLTPGDPGPGHRAPLSALALGTQDTLAATGARDGTIGIWDASTGESLQWLAGSGRPVTQLAFSPNDRILSAVSAKVLPSDPVAPVVLWDLGQGRPLRSLVPQGDASSVAFSADGHLIFLGEALSGAKGESPGASAGAVTVWDAVSGEAVRRLSGVTARVQTVAACAKGTLVAAGDLAGRVTLWSWPSGRRSRRLAGAQGPVRRVAFSPGCNKLAAIDQAGRLLLWNIAAGRLIRTWGSEQPGSEQPGSEQPGSEQPGSEQPGADQAGNAQAGNAQTGGAQVGRGPSPLTDVAFFPDGNTVATGGGHPRVWSLAQSTPLVELPFAPPHTSAVAVSASGRYLLSGGGGGSALVWRFALQRPDPGSDPSP